LESGFAFNNGVFVLSQGLGTITTTDGVTWKPGPATFYRRIVSAGAAFLGSSGDSVATSRDGVIWQTAFSLPNSVGALFPALGKSNDQWLAGGASGSLYSSADGQTWNAIVGPIDYS